MLFKRLLYWKLAKKYKLHKWDAVLPTGCGVIFERVLAKENIADEDTEGKKIELVNKEISYILAVSIPILGIIPLVKLILWRCKVLHNYIIPLLSPGINEWLQLVFTLLPEIRYLQLHSQNYNQYICVFTV